MLDDDLAIAAEPAPPADERAGRERRRYVRTITDDPLPAPPAAPPLDRAALGRIAIRRVAREAPVPSVATAPTAAPASTAAGATLGEATRAIRRGTDRDRVAELVIDTVARFVDECEAAILLVVRGDVAIGWKGFCRGDAGLPEIGVPLEDGLIPRVVSRGTTLRAPASDLCAIDQRLLAKLGASTGDLVVVPVTIASQVMCVIVLVTPPDVPAGSAESIAAAAGAAFARLMRAASR